MKTTRFNPNAKQSAVNLHYATLISAHAYYYKRRNDERCAELRAEMEEMKSVYTYL